MTETGSNETRQWTLEPETEYRFELDPGTSLAIKVSCNGPRDRWRWLIHPSAYSRKRRSFWSRASGRKTLSIRIGMQGGCLHLARVYY